jgi:hypothetical protein
MAKRNTSKARSLDQENFVARTYGGRRSPSSGAQANDPGDVRTDSKLIECKQTGEVGKTPYPKSFSLKLGEFEKIYEEALKIMRDPMMAVRVYNPDSPLADKDGNVDFAVRLMRHENE